ncbi:MAG: redoxin domain-containing protein [Chitinophagaceae bacterium]
MKNTIILSALLLSAVSLHAQQSFEIKGKISDPALEGAKVTLNYVDGGKYHTDSAFMKNGTFNFKGVVAEPVQGTLTVKMKPAQKPTLAEMLAPPVNRAEVYLEKGTVSLEGKGMSVAKVKGGRSTTEFMALKNAQRPFKEKQVAAILQIGKLREAKDSMGMVRARALHERLKEQEDSVAIAFIKNNPGSYVAISMLKERANPKALSENRSEVQASFNRFSTAMQQSIAGKEIARRLEVTGRIGAGKMAPDFTMNDTLGNPVSLSAFKGKYVLLDFWASWCMPCRFENPSVVKAYNEFKDKNFTILAVSLDRPGAKQAWLDAIHKDGLTWTHVSDLQFWNSAAVKLYGVNSVPMNYLIGPDGKIIATYLRGEALREKLKELLH